MHPELLRLGPLTLHTYGLLVALGLVAGLIVSIHMGKREGFSSQRILDMAFGMVLAGVVLSRLLYVLLNPSYFLSTPWKILQIWEGGLVFSGGVLGALGAAAWYVRRHHFSLWTLGDVFAPGLALGQAIGRIGCFMAGCCYGRPTDVPWAVVFTHPRSLAPIGVPIHPTQLYHSLAGFIIFLALFWVSARKRFAGQVFVWFLILHSTDDRGLFPGTEMSLTQGITLLLLLGSVVALWVLKSRARPNPSQRKRER